MELIYLTTLLKTSVQMFTQELISVEIICKKILFSYIIKLSNSPVLMIPNPKKFSPAELSSVMMLMVIIHVQINQTALMDVEEDRLRTFNQQKSFKSRNHTVKVSKAQLV